MAFDTKKLKTLAMARDIEQAFKNYLGTEAFPTAEWPAAALAIAKVVTATDGVHAMNEGSENTYNAQELVRRMSELDCALADLVGL